jgi:hypothetical protein
MSKLTLAVATALLAGCASMGEWRTLTIDGGSEAAFGDSLSRLNDELSYSRARMLALALVDLTNSGVLNAGETSDGTSAYTEEDLRRDLDGLTYEGVIALADQTGPAIRTLYYSRGWGVAEKDANRLLRAGDHTLGPTPPRMPSIDSSGTISWPDQ